ncbi:MAG: B12-binding domain-containing radical SAM protein [Desulfobacterales bacterium]|nr:B12-binding domain-containing radical SAM protein [Desulfobacterales bacterium]
MKVALIAPSYPLSEAPSPPLGLCYVASSCQEAGANVKIFDYIVRGYTQKKLIEELSAFKPDIVGAGSVTMNFKIAAEMIRTAKKYNPSIITMLGGCHVSFDIKNTLDLYPEVDIIVIGESEDTLKELIPVIHKKELWEGINGIAFRRNNEIIITNPRDFVADLDSLPIPSRHFLPMSRYQALGFPASIITSRGCPNKCIFCLGRKMVGYKVRYRSPKLIVDEIEDIMSYGITRINIADDIFTANKNRVKAFCNEIQKRQINFAWSAFSRVNTIDFETLEMMKNTGCDSVSFGIESGNPEMLKKIKKGITLDQARYASELCNKVGIIGYASFIIGLPGETQETLMETKSFAENLGIKYGYHMLAPFPGTALREEVEKYDIEILTNDWDLYDANRAIVQTSSLKAKELDNFMDGINNVFEKVWSELKEKYASGNASDYEKLLVEGNKRMNLIFKLLSEDILEEIAIKNNETNPVVQVASIIANITNLEENFVETVIQSLMDKGYIKNLNNGEIINWLWTHNNQSECV